MRPWPSYRKTSLPGGPCDETVPYPYGACRVPSPIRMRPWRDYGRTSRLGAADLTAKLVTLPILQPTAETFEEDFKKDGYTVQKVE
mgnify:CR=1 FL=1